MSKFKPGDVVKIVASYAPNSDKPYLDKNRNNMIGLIAVLGEKEDWWTIKADHPLAGRWVWEERELSLIHREFFPSELFKID